MINSITKRFIACHDYLKSTGVIRSSASFAYEIETHRQTLNDILKGRREVRTEMIQHAIEKFYFNPYYLFSGQGEMFVNPDNESEEEINNIRLVPIKAQAGYSNHILDPIYQAKLPTFRLPITKLGQEDYTCFEIEGESMYPSLEDGDAVICSLLDPNYYAHTVKSDKVHVVVTNNEVLVKRVINKMHPGNIITLVSDNEDFKPKNMRMEKVKQIWKVEATIKSNILKPEKSIAKIEDQLAVLIKEIKEKKQ